MDILASNLPLVVSILWLLYHTVMFMTPLVYGSLSIHSAHFLPPRPHSAAAVAAPQATASDAPTYIQTGVQPQPDSGAVAAGGPWRGIPAGIRFAFNSLAYARQRQCVAPALLRNGWHTQRNTPSHSPLLAEGFLAS